MTLIQIILLIVIFLIIVKTWRKYQRDSITVREFFLWTCFWLIAAVAVIFPKATDRVAKFVGIGQGSDLIVYLSLVLLFSILFYIVIRIEKIERDITKIVREKALDENLKSQISNVKSTS